MRNKLAAMLMLLIATLGLARSGEAHPCSQRLGQALTQAAWDLDVFKVQTLLKQGADPNARGYIGGTWKTPVLAAVWHGCDPGNSCLPVLECLVAHGADLNKRSTGTTPLIYVANLGSPRLIRFLIAKGTDLNTRDDDGRTALSRAACEDGSCGWGSSPVNGVLLVKAGADVNIEDRTGTTPLIYLTFVGDGSGNGRSEDNLPFLRSLLAQGANARLRDKHGITALQSAWLIDKQAGDEAETIQVLQNWLAKSQRLTRSGHILRSQR